MNVSTQGRELKMQHSEQETGQSVGLRVRRIVTGMHVAVPLFALGLGLLLMLGATVSLIVGSWDSVALLRVLTLALCGSLLAFGLALYRLRRELIEPLARLEDSVSKVCSGEPGAKLALKDTGVERKSTRLKSRHRIRSSRPSAS